jgi:hypothetical protein
VEEKPDDDEIPNYITELNTVIAKQEITSKPEVITKIALTSQNKILLISANHKKENSYLSDQLDKLKFSLTIFMEAV